MSTPSPGTSDEPGTPAYLALLDVLRCPYCRSAFLDPTAVGAGAGPDELLCSSCRRAYPVRGGIPVLLVDEARLPDEEGADGPEGTRG